MKIKDFIKKTLDALPDDIIEIGFNLGIGESMEVEPNSHNRVSFTFEKNKKGKKK